MKSSCEYMKYNSEHAYVTVINRSGLCWYKGIAEKSASVIVELNINGVIEVNVDSHTLLRVNGEDVNGIERNRVLDLSDDGERWEGDVLHNKPCGWGVLYDSENRMVYEGFRIGEMNVCYGRSYYPDVGVIEYEGEICEGKRWGRGVQCDRNGDVTINGEWIDDAFKLEKRVAIDSGIISFQNRIEELIVSGGCCNGREWIPFDFSILHELRVFKTGDCCFENVDKVKLIGLGHLERVVIGANCFTKHKDNEPRSMIPSRHFYLKNCERLRELKMGRYSFSDYSVCEIENVPSLEVIEMGDLDEWSRNFYYASLELKSVIDGMK